MKKNFIVRIKYTRFYYFGIIILVLQLIACKKYLDEKSDKQLVVPESVEDLQAILDDNIPMNSLTPAFGEASADDYFLTPAKYNGLNETFRKAFIWDLSSYLVGSADWKNSYGAIYSANYCLEQIEKVDRSVQIEKEWNNVKGSALFFRAYYFLNTVWENSKAYDESSAQTDLGIPLRLTSNINIASVRATVKESYEQVIKDAHEAVSFLPDHPSHVMRPSKAAAFGLLARAYLSMRNYDSAFKYADMCLQIKSDLLDYNNSDEVKPSLQNPFPSTNREIIFFTTISGGFGSKAPTNALIDTVLYSSYANDDIRKSAFFIANTGYRSFKGSYNGISRLTLFSGIATDEMYLTRAECYARAGNKDAALNDLNALLEKRWKTGFFIPVTAASAQEALNIILLERRKELLMRGLRWIDIKRLNKEGANITPVRIIESQTYTLSPNSDKYALPLPTDIISITDMPQNPGWE